jgi:hypothetical protein
MGKKLLSADQQQELGIMSPEVKARMADRYASGGSAGAASSSEPAAVVADPAAGGQALFNYWEDAVECAGAAAGWSGTGSCYTCRDCGTDTGCS